MRPLLADGILLKAWLLNQMAEAGLSARSGDMNLQALYLSAIGQQIPSKQDFLQNIKNNILIYFLFRVRALLRHDIYSEVAGGMG